MERGFNRKGRKDLSKGHKVLKFELISVICGKKIRSEDKFNPLLYRKSHSIFR
jgi:hypothetical protein